MAATIWWPQLGQSSGTHEQKKDRTVSALAAQVHLAEWNSSHDWQWNSRNRSPWTAPTSTGSMTSSSEFVPTDHIFM